MGQALRLAQLIRGMDVIENIDRLIAIASVQLHRRCRAQPGRERRFDFEQTKTHGGHTPQANRAVTIGLLPTVPVSSAGGEKAFTFVPYTGALISDPTEREILDRARAIVACVRYGERHALASKIRYPVALLQTLLDRSRDHALNQHTEIKEQYAQLVKRGVGTIERNGAWYRFRLIPSEENLRAVRLAIELISHGEILEERVRLDVDQHAAMLAPGDIGTEFDGIRIAHSCFGSWRDGRGRRSMRC